DLLGFGRRCEPRERVADLGEHLLDALSVVATAVDRDQDRAEDHEAESGDPAGDQIRKLRRDAVDAGGAVPPEEDQDEPGQTQDDAELRAETLEALEPVHGRAFALRSAGLLLRGAAFLPSRSAVPPRYCARRSAPLTSLPRPENTSVPFSRMRTLSA